jgi:hypothetical protein
MKRRPILIGLGLSLALAASLLARPPVTHAQDALTEVYTWPEYNLTVEYPAGWSAIDNDGVISLHPADRDVSDGQGPEMILFALPDVGPDQLDTAIDPYRTQFEVGPGAVTADELEGYPRRSFAFKQSNPAVVGGVALVAVDATTALSIAYIVRTSEAGVYLPTLEAMYASLTFGAAAAPQPTSMSQGVASVQLAQRFMWTRAGLVLYVPTDWSIQTEEEDGEETLDAVPSETSEDDQRAIAAITLAGIRATDLHEIADIMLEDYEALTAIEDRTVAGYPAVVFDMLDHEYSPPHHLRGLIVAQDERDMTLVFLFRSLDSQWMTFRPLVSAFISSIEPLGGGLF